MLILCDPAIKQIRVFVGFILQPDLKLPKIVPDPEKNKEGKEMNLLKLTIQSSLRYDPSGIKVFFTIGDDRDDPMNYV